VLYIVHFTAFCLGGPFFSGHCAGTVQSQGVGYVKQVSFKLRPEDCYGRCGSDKIWQTVPDTCSGDRESSVTDSKESGAADNH